MRIVGKILVAVQHAVLVKPGREQPHAALKVVVDRNAHRGRVPVVAVFVGNGAAVACAGHKPARLGGKRVGRLQRERSQRGLGGVHTICVGVVLGAGAGVLQIIRTVVLCHKRALNVGLVDSVKHGGQNLGVQPRHLRHLGRSSSLPVARYKKASWLCKARLPLYPQSRCYRGAHSPVLLRARKSVLSFLRWASWYRGQAPRPRWARCWSSPSKNIHARHHRRTYRDPKRRTGR